MEMQGARIALVTAQDKTVAPLVHKLALADYDVSVMSPGRELADKLTRLAPHLALYGIWGDQELRAAQLACVCRTVQVPVIVIGGPVNSFSAVEALRCGADGYLDERHSLDAILAHAQAALRRFWEWGGQQPSNPTWHLWHRDGPSSEDGDIALTPTEARMLSYLRENAGQVVSRHELYQHIWGHKPGKRDMRSLSLFIHNLRCKIERDPHRPEYLLTRWGVGYCLSDDYGAS
jgi:DNA-binding response OmpR family regulator